MRSRQGAYNSCRHVFFGLALLVWFQQAGALAVGRDELNSTVPGGRQRIRLDTGWRFRREESNPDNLIYDDVRTDVSGEGMQVLKPWILPAANDFINDPSKHHERPSGNPGGNVSFVQRDFDDSNWETVRVPHDWAIKGPFYVGNEEDIPVGGGMGRLPSQGVGWYRRKLTVTGADKDKLIYLDIDGAMSYAAVWVNGYLVGGWPFGYNSFRLDITEYIKTGDDNQLAIRLDNPLDSSRWYPGGGLYRNVWLTKVNTAHISQWGTHVTYREVSTKSATVDLVVQVENDAEGSKQVEVATDVYVFEADTARPGVKVTSFPSEKLEIQPGQKQSIPSSATIQNPRLWGPPPTQHPDLYIATTRLYIDGQVADTYETRFGIRSLVYDPDQGLLVNGEHIRIQGVNQHHDLGALGAAFNARAAERQLETLRDLGANAVRTSHNPPAPELLDLTDRLGFLVLAEIFDSWELNKTDNDFHLLFADWHEPDLRAFVRRERNHPSVFAWSFGNEVFEQLTNEAGAAIGQALRAMMHEEDATRLATASMNFAKPNMSFPTALDFLSLNYQGEGVRNTPAYAHLPAGGRTPPLYGPFHEAFPDKLLLSTETAAVVSSRGTYLFPVTGESTGAPVNDTSGGDSRLGHVSAYELYTADFGASADRAFAAQDAHPFVAGEFVWSGWDYLGEPTPYDNYARSSYFGIVDLAGFPKDRFYLYRARWRPDLPAAHILPHWSWPDRVGQVTPVHVFSAADEVELFLNGKQLGGGRRVRDPDHAYRFRWDDVVYEPGELRAVAYKGGRVWATETVRTVGDPAGLRLKADRDLIKGDGEDVAFVTVEVIDRRGDVVPRADDTISFSVISGPGEIAATDNGDPTDLTPFPSTERKTFSGRALGIVRANAGAIGPIIVEAAADGLPTTKITLVAS
ncbi:hypothetical protein SLS62_000295 [Diatrype stigma]|uniref:Beta-galactosidase n=1 Tax=Diatrype stigma TaxID=117547 RepID=A0AAN9V2K5_9PEZI